MEKVQWNSIDKKQNGLKYSKNYKSSTLPRGSNVKEMKFEQNNVSEAWLETAPIYISNTKKNTLGKKL